MKIFKSNARWVRALIGVVDQPSRDTAKALAVMGGTSSPAARGGGNQWHCGGMSGDISNPSQITLPLQKYAGIDTREIQYHAMQSGAGDIMGGHAPNTAGPENSSLLWMSLGKQPGVGYA